MIPAVKPMTVLELGPVRYPLEVSAISALRYRAAYGESIVETLGARISPKMLEGKLLRMCHLMIPVGSRPELLELAKQARRDGAFFIKGLQARDALLAPDPELEGWEDDTPSSHSRFDEYKLLAVLTMAGVDLRLLYELPLLHLAGLVRRLNVLRDPDRKSYRLLSQKEMAQLYPRPKKSSAAGGGG